MVGFASDGEGHWVALLGCGHRHHVRGAAIELAPDAPGTVVPELPHRVEPVGAVRFFVEFLRVPGPPA